MEFRSGFSTAVFMARFCPEKIYNVLKPSVELLAGIPSVVYGFFGLVVMVPFIREHIGWYRQQYAYGFTAFRHDDFADTDQRR